MIHRRQRNLVSSSSGFHYPIEKVKAVTRLVEWRREGGFTPRGRFTPRRARASGGRPSGTGPSRVLVHFHELLPNCIAQVGARHRGEDSLRVGGVELRDG